MHPKKSGQTAFEYPGGCNLRFPVALCSSALWSPTQVISFYVFLTWARGLGRPPEGPPGLSGGLPRTSGGLPGTQDKAKQQKPRNLKELTEQWRSGCNFAISGRSLGVAWPSSGSISSRLGARRAPHRPGIEPEEAQTTPEGRPEIINCSHMEYRPVVESRSRVKVD